MSKNARQRRAARRARAASAAPEERPAGLLRWERLVTEAVGEFQDQVKVVDGGSRGMLYIARAWSGSRRFIYGPVSWVDSSSDDAVRDSLIATIAREGLAHV